MNNKKKIQDFGKFMHFDHQNFRGELAMCFPLSLNLKQPKKNKIRNQNNGNFFLLLLQFCVIVDRLVCLEWCGPERFDR